MKYFKMIKSISCFKTHASELIRSINENQGTMIVTRHGEGKVVVQDIRVFEQTHESLAMLKLLAQSKTSLQQGRFKPAAKAFGDLAVRINKGQD